MIAVGLLGIVSGGVSVASLLMLARYLFLAGNRETDRDRSKIYWACAGLLLVVAVIGVLMLASIVHMTVTWGR